jgi:fructose-bisphosphate aldolase, class I
MSAGLTYRLGRVFGRDGQAMILPVDHGIMLGRVRGLEDPRVVLADALTAGVDGLLMAPGLVRATAESFAERGAPARLLTLRQGSTVLVPYRAGATVLEGHLRAVRCRPAAP